MAGGKDLPWQDPSAPSPGPRSLFMCLGDLRYSITPRARVNDSVFMKLGWRHARIRPSPSRTDTVDRKPVQIASMDMTARLSFIKCWIGIQLLDAPPDWRRREPDLVSQLLGALAGVGLERLQDQARRPVETFVLHIGLF